MRIQVHLLQRIRRKLIHQEQCGQHTKFKLNITVILNLRNNHLMMNTGYDINTSIQAYLRIRKLPSIKS